ncbi:MAG: hypothetical protein WA871_13795 [Candidatus Acidiferrales bacterium]
MLLEEKNIARRSMGASSGMTKLALHYPTPGGESRKVFASLVFLTRSRLIAASVEINERSFNQLSGTRWRKFRKPQWQ